MSPEVRRSSRGRRLRRLRRRVEQHPGRSALVVLGALVVVFAIWAGWRAWTVSRDLHTAADKAEVMRAALQRGDVAGARKALGEFQGATSSADSHTHGPTWAIAGVLPFVGDDADGTAVMASVLDDIGTHGLPPVVSAAGEVTGDSFQPHDHRFPLARISSLVGPAATSQKVFATSDRRLSGVDSSGFVAPFRTRFDEMRSLVGSSRDLLGSVYRAARMMPDLLGADGPRNYLLVLDNNAELRSMGGLAGSVTLVHADHGAVHIAAQDDMADVGPSARPRLTADEKRLFGPLLSVTGVNATMTPDGGRAAELVRDRWVAQHGGRVDGVFFVDPVAVSYLLQGLGRVVPAGYPAISAMTVVQAVESQVYLLSDDRQAQSDYQNAVAKAVFNTFADGSGDPVTAIRGLAQGVAEHRVTMHSFVADDQRQVAGTAIAGEFPRTATAHPQAGVYVNDSTESKMSYFLQYDAHLAARACGDGIQEAVGDLTLTNATPAALQRLPLSVTGWGDRSRAITKGQQFVVVYLTSPIGGVVTSLSIDGRRLHDPAFVSFEGRKVATVGVHLDPRETHHVTWTMSSGVRQTGSWQLSVTPGAQAGTQSATEPTAC